MGRRFLLTAPVALAAVLVGAPTSASAVALELPSGTVERVSADTVPATGGRETPAIGPGGRYVTFVGRGEGAGVWFYDRDTDTTERLTDRTGKAGDFNPSVSDDGRYVAFVRYGSNRTVYVCDRQNPSAGPVVCPDDRLVVMSKSSADAQANGNSDFPSVSATGRYVAFHSTASNLDPAPGGPAGPGGSASRVYVHDRDADEDGIFDEPGAGTRTVMVSVNSFGEESSSGAFFPDLTPDGRYVAFMAEGANLSSLGCAIKCIYVHDRDADENDIYDDNATSGGVSTEIVSVGTDGADDVVPDGDSAAEFGPKISNDAQFVTFESDAANLLAPGEDTNGDRDAFLYDRTLGMTLRLSVDSEDNEVDLDVLTSLETGLDVDQIPVIGGAPAISGDGTFVTFQSDAALTPDDMNDINSGTCPNYVRDLYGYSMLTDTLQRVSVAVEGGSEAGCSRVDGNTNELVAQSNGIDPSVSDDGVFVAFVSNADLAADRVAGETEEPSEPATFVRRMLRFLDVGPLDFGYDEINIIAANGITVGCNPTGDLYCPDDPVTRAQAAVFMERAVKGGDHVPAPGTGEVFDDVPSTHWAVAWVEEFYGEGYTSGCQTLPLLYCPQNPATRAQIAVFLLRGKYGADYVPPAATGTEFGDVPVDYWAAAWIEKLKVDGITNGCGDGSNYCPDKPVTRAEMAVLLVRTFFMQ